MRKRRVVGRIHGRNTVERVIKTEIDTRTEKRSGLARLVYVKNIKRAKRRYLPVFFLSFSLN